MGEIIFTGPLVTDLKPGNVIRIGPRTGRVRLTAVRSAGDGKWEIEAEPFPEMSVAELEALSDDEIAELSTDRLLAALSAMTEMHRNRRKRLYDLLAISRREGITWAAIAEHLGLDSPQAAQQRWKQLDREFCSTG